MVKNLTDNGVLPALGTLQRGKACLRCRKRKMRCDGAKPACQQCCRAKKSEGCEYDDGRGKTRTQILRETICRLEQRIRELEDPEFTSPSVTLFNPHIFGHHPSCDSSSSISDSPVITTTHSSFSDPGSSPPPPVWGLSGGQSPSPSPLDEPFRFDEPLLPFELAQMLLDIFTPHRHQCGLELHMGRLRDSLRLSPSEQRHPALMNSIFLWSCYVSRPGPLSQHESHYLARALEALGDALRFRDKVVDAIQASCLLSMYFLANGRMLEGSYHSSAAASLAIQCGLHRGVSRDANTSFEPTDALKLLPPKDIIEEGERILAFWQVYNLDRCWSVVLRKPSTIADGGDALSAINLPWPQNMEDYESGQQDERRHVQTIRSFFDGQASNLSGGFSTVSLRVKASALFERADRLSASWDPRMSASNAFREEIQSLERTITRFIPTLIPVHQLEATMLEDKHALLIIHSLANAAMIHLYYRFGNDDQMSYEKALRAARSCVGIIKLIGDADFDFLDPIIGPCWTCAAEVLIRELNNMEASWPLLDTTDVRSELGVILYAMSSLMARYPLLGFPTAKVEKRLSQM